MNKLARANKLIDKYNMKRIESVGVNSTLRIELAIGNKEVVKYNRLVIKAVKVYNSLIK